MHHLNDLETIFMRFVWIFKIWKSTPGVPRGTFQESGYFQKSGSIFFSDQNYFFAQHPVTVSIEWEPPKAKYRQFFTSLQNFPDPNRKWHMRNRMRILDTSFESWKLIPKNCMPFKMRKFSIFEQFYDEMYIRTTIQGQSWWS